jgi:hypothetical protein
MSKFVKITVLYFCEVVQVKGQFSEKNLAEAAY